MYIYIYICHYLYNLLCTTSLLNFFLNFKLINTNIAKLLWDMKTNNGFSKFISMKKFDYKYHRTAVIIHLEIIYFHCLEIVLFILLYFACKPTIFIL